MQKFRFNRYLYSSIPTSELILTLDTLMQNVNLENTDKIDLEIVPSVVLNKIIVHLMYIVHPIAKFIGKKDQPMRSPLSPVVAQILMNSHSEETLINNNNFLLQTIFFWARYVDEIFRISIGTDKQN